MLGSVSILVLMEVLLRHNTEKKPILGSVVSILVLMEVLLRQGQRAPFLLKKEVPVSILVLMEVLLRLENARVFGRAQVFGFQSLF